MASAGDLNRRLRFEERAPADDGYGNTRADWAERFTVWAAITPLKGGEQVMAGRLAGMQPVVIQIRRSVQALTVRADWRAVDARTGEIMSITSPPADMKGDRAFLDMLATIGAGS